MKKFFCFGKDDFCENPVKCEGCEHFKRLGGERREAPKTNADHIRSMTDEELAEFLMSDICGKVSPKDFDCYGACVDCATIWLKQPYSGGE